MSTLHEYEASMDWTGGREGRLEAPGLPPLDVASPPEFGGEAGRWTPEHFFVASTTACVLLTFLAIADFSKLAVRKASSSGKGRLEKVEGGLRFTAVDVTLSVEVETEADIERAERLAQKAEKSCLVTRSLDTPVRVTAKIERYH